MAHAGDHARAVAEVEDLIRGDQVPAETLCDAACTYAPLLGGRERKRQTHGAIRYPGGGTAEPVHGQGYFKGTKPVGLLKTARDLNSLRHREDFKALLKAVEAAQASPEKKPGD